MDISPVPLADALINLSINKVIKRVITSYYFSGDAKRVSEVSNSDLTRELTLYPGRVPQENDRNDENNDDAFLLKRGPRHSVRGMFVIDREAPKSPGASPTPTFLLQHSGGGRVSPSVNLKRAEEFRQGNRNKTCKEET
ncbi:hypothetical protein RUM44_003628 [Polyplax serrata]|uniref:Uncharacterized protein n=1 Tax=Polyplax serrata TaxID=468196 RepID=A0ABR1AH03_POLSC